MATSPTRTGPSVPRKQDPPEDPARQATEEGDPTYDSEPSKIGFSHFNLAASVANLPLPSTKPAEPPKSTAQTSQVIEEWMSQFDGPSNILPAQKFQGDDASIALVTDFLLSNHDKTDVFQKLYETLLILLRSANENVSRFIAQLYPALIWRHFTEYSQKTYRSTRIPSGLDALLLAIYTVSTVDEHGVSKVQTFVLPSMVYSSVYHKATEFSKQWQSYINRQIPLNGYRVPVHPFPEVARITRSSRWHVMVYLVQTLNDYVAHCSGACHRSIITVSQRLLKNSLGYREDTSVEEKKEFKRQSSGRRTEALAAAFHSLKPNFDKFQAHLDQLKDKIRKNPPEQPSLPPFHFDPRFLLEWTQLLYTLMYQGYFEESYAFIKDIQREAEYRMLPDLLLVTNAVLNRADNTVSASSYDELLPRVDLALAEEVRKDLQRDIGMVSRTTV